MSETIDFVARRGYVLLFFWVLVEQAALPISSVPLLLVSGSLARANQLHLPAFSIGNIAIVYISAVSCSRKPIEAST